MNKRIKKTISIILLLNLLSTNNNFGALSLNSINKQLAILEKEKTEFDKIQNKTQEISTRLEEHKAVKNKLASATGKTNLMLSKKLSLITQDHQVLSEIEQVRQHFNMLLEEHIKILQEYKNDPEFSKFKLPAKSFYNFDEFEDLGRRILHVKTRLTDIEKSHAAIQDDLNKRRKAYTALEDELKSDSNLQEKSLEGLTKTQQAELKDLQKRLLEDKKLLAAAKVKEAEQELLQLESQQMILKAELSVLRDHYENVKQELHVDSLYLNKSETELDRKRGESATERERLRNDIKALTLLKDEIHRKTIETAHAYHLNSNDISSIQDLSKTPTTISEWTALCSIGHKALEETVIDLEREYKEALIELEKAKIRKEEIQHATIRSWHSLTQEQLGFNTYTLEQQIQSYQAPKAEIQGDLALLTERRTRALASLQDLNAALERIKQLGTTLKEKRDEFKDQLSNQYSLCSQQIRDFEEQVHRRLYLTAKLIEVYSTAIATLEDTIKRIEHVITELGTKNFWSRSDQSITLRELKRFGPDILRFINDVKIGLKHNWHNLSLASLRKAARNYPLNSSFFLLLLLRIFILLLVYWALRLYLPELQSYLEKKPGYFVHSNWRLLLAVIINFINENLLGLYIWFLIYCFIALGLITNVYIVLIFYLSSIPYMLYITHKFINYFLQINEKHDSLFISGSYKSRFKIVAPFFIYSTIIIFFFRKSFMVGSYHTSTVPTVLLAINYIILQLALMSLISKEWILSIIPKSTPLWEWISSVISRYYYVFWAIIVALIIMSYPYIGYGRQVLYVISRIFIIGLIIPVLSYLYTRIRRTASDLFFYSSEGESVKERFASSRAWYGLFIITLFVFFIILGIILIAKAAGYHVNFHDIWNWLSYELYSPGVDEVGRRLSVTPVAFLKFIAALLVGIITAYLINNILLRKIFDPLLISSGVQNVIFTLTRYFIIFLALLVGMKSVGLESFATRLVLVLGAVGFAVKDPLLDFFSYFIILVQRPIKIGDLIMLDAETRGIVRHITPRSVVLRKDNSVTIIVPNSAIITRPVINWTYSPTFFGLNDILLAVSYAHDPEKVKGVITKILDSNPNILKAPAPVIRLDNFTENGFQFLIRGYVTAEKVLEQWEIASNLRLEIIRTFRAEKIELAVPIRTVKMISEFPENKQKH